MMQMMQRTGREDKGCGVCCLDQDAMKMRTEEIELGPESILITFERKRRILSIASA